MGDRSRSCVQCGGSIGAVFRMLDLYTCSGECADAWEVAIALGPIPNPIRLPQPWMWEEGHVASARTVPNAEPDGRCWIDSMGNMRCHGTSVPIEVITAVKHAWERWARIRNGIADGL